MRLSVSYREIWQKIKIVDYRGNAWGQGSTWDNLKSINIYLAIKILMSSPDPLSVPYDIFIPENILFCVPGVENNLNHDPLKQILSRIMKKESSYVKRNRVRPLLNSHLSSYFKWFYLNSLHQPIQQLLKMQNKIPRYFQLIQSPVSPGLKIKSDYPENISKLFNNKEKRYYIRMSGRS